MNEPDPLAAHLAHLRVRNLRPTSIQQRSYVLRRLARSLGCEPADLLAATPEDLARWELANVHLSPSYRSSCSAHVRQFYRWAQTQRLVREDPSVGLAQVRRPRGLPHPIR